LEEKEQIREILLELFSAQKLAVLGTHQAGQPYGSLVAFAATPDLKSLLFATTRATRKFANLQADSRVSMVFDNRSNRVADFRKAVAATAHHSRTFVSGIDGSVQYFGVAPMAGAGTGRAEAAAGPRPALVLTLHGASVEAIGQARAYNPKDWAWIIAATNRRPYGFDWEDWGRLDALEVLAEATRLFAPDPARIYLTGHSMGGHGTWQVGATVPGPWAAIAPSAGWHSFTSYGGGATYKDPSPVEKMLLRANNPSETTALARNFLSYGIYVLHGDQDDNVPVGQARTMRGLLGAFHPDFAYYERPGAGHWWGNECVDWPPLLQFLKERVRPADAAVRKIEFVTADPGISAGSRWIGILAQRRPLEYSKVVIERDEAGKTFKGTTENVERLAIDVPAAALGGGEGEGKVTFELDGSKVEAQLTPGAGSIYLERQDTGWLQTAAPPLGLKGFFTGRITSGSRMQRPTRFPATLLPVTVMQSP